MASSAQLELLEHFRIKSGQESPSTQRRHQEAWKRIKELGRGGYGVVYLETNAGNGNARALKEIRKMRGADFKAELIALTRLSRPAYAEHFGQFLGWYEDPVTISFAMEYFELGDLRPFIKETAFPESDAREIAWQLLSGLSVMHEDGFTHRDLKPENIFVVQTSPKWRVKIGDFGVSKRIQNDDTVLQTYVGTRNYIAPEVQDLDEEEPSGYTNAVDIWAVGIIIYELLSTRRPFANYRTLQKYCRCESSFPHQALRSNGVSEDAISLVRLLLSPIASERPDAATALEASWLINGIEFLETTHVSSLPSGTPPRAFYGSEYTARLSPFTQPEVELSRSPISVPSATSSYVSESKLPILDITSLAFEASGSGNGPVSASVSNVAPPFHDGGAVRGSRDTDSWSRSNSPIVKGPRNRSQNQAIPTDTVEGAELAAAAPAQTRTDAAPESTVLRLHDSDPSALNDDGKESYPVATELRVSNDHMTSRSLHQEQTTTEDNISNREGKLASTDLDKTQPQLPSIHFVPYFDPDSSSPSLSFSTISRTLLKLDSIIRVGRYSEQDPVLEAYGDSTSDAVVGFKTKVISRRHCEFSYLDSDWWIKDVKSSSGTFLNNIRLSQPGVESRLYKIKDGDIVQLGVNFQGGKEWITRCVKIRILCNRNISTAVTLENGERGATSNEDVLKVAPYGGREEKVMISRFVRDNQRVEYSAVSFSSDSRVVACATPRTVSILDTMTGTELSSVQERRPQSWLRRSFSSNTVKATALLLEAQLIAYAVADRVEIWNTETGAPMKTIKGHSCNAIALAVNEHQLLATGGADRSMVLWNIASGMRVLTIPEVDDEFSILKFSPDSQIIVSGGNGFKSWDTITGTRLVDFHGRQGLDLRVSAIAFSSNGQLVAALSQTRELGGLLKCSATIWDATRGFLQRTLNLDHDKLIMDIAFSPNGFFALMAEETIGLYSLKQAEKYCILKMNLQLVRRGRIAFSPNGQHIAATSRAGVEIWDIP